MPLRTGPLWVAAAVALAPPVASGDSLLVANKSDHTVHRLDLTTGEATVELTTGLHPHEIAVAPDGRTAVVSNYGNRDEPGSTLTVLDLATDTVVATVDLGEHRRPHGLAWISSTEVAVTAEATRHLLVVAPQSVEVLRAIETGQEVSHMVVVEAASRRAFVANIGSGTVTVIDLASGEKLADIETGEGAEGIAVRPGSGEIWVGNRAADTLSVLDAASLEIVAEVPCPGFPIRLAFTPDGDRLLVSAARSGELVLFDAAGRLELTRAPLNLQTAPDAADRLFGDRFGASPVPVGLVVAPDGATAWVAATQADVVVEVDAATLEVRRLLHAGREPDGMALSAGND